MVGVVVVPYMTVETSDELGSAQGCSRGPLIGIIKTGVLNASAELQKPTIHADGRRNIADLYDLFGHHSEFHH